MHLLHPQFSALSLDPSMIFACGIFTVSDGAAPGDHIGRMLEAEGRGNSVTSTEGDGLLSLATHAGAVHRASAGPVTGVLLRPADGQGGATGLAETVERYAATQTFAPDDVAGVFLLILVDAERRSLVVANDRFGICPLHYAEAGESFLFSTDLDALAAHPALPARVSAQSLYQYVFFHCIPSPDTVYEGVHKLPPGTAVQAGASGSKPVAYWRASFAADDAPADAGLDRLGRELLEVLERAVAERVTEHCGAFLSGGLDSSTVSGMLQRATGAARTFTIGFDAEGYDESAFARIAADHFGTTHEAYFVTPADVAESLPRIAACYGEPFGNSSVIPTYHCARFARLLGVDSLLAGDGGDELFAGNTRYTDQNVFEAWFRAPDLLRSALKLGYRVAPWLERLPVTGKGARYIRQAEMGLPDRLQSYNFLHRFDPGTVFAPDWLEGVDTDRPWSLWHERYAEPAEADALQRMLYLDWKFTLADNDLVKVNRMCALAGVGVSYPMLDDRVVALSCRVPPRTLLLGGKLRGFYKHACRDFLPSRILTKSKHGFGLPFGVWMREDEGLKGMVSDAFAGLRGRGLFRGEFLDEAQRLYEREAAGYYGELAWILTMLELWLAAHPRASV